VHAAAGGVAFLNASTAVVAEWQLGKVLRVALRNGATSAYLTGFTNPLPILTTTSGALLVGDWGTGRIYEITER
jgi:hypothetical protein